MSETNRLDPSISFPTVAGCKDKARQLWDEMPDGDEHDGRTFYEFWADDLGRGGDDFPAYGYDLAAAGWLCAIHERFAALYNAAHPEQASA